VTFVRGMWTDRIDHSTAQFTFVTGHGVTGFPSIGAWAGYALGTENQNLPSFIALGDPPTIGMRAHSSAWLPPIYSGTSMRPDAQAPMFDIRRPGEMTPERQARLLHLIQGLNREEAARYPLDQELEARIANYELAAKMQMEAVATADFSGEGDAVKKLYGLDEPSSGQFGKLCLLARRLSERGVRFVQIYAGGGGNWDTHNNIEGQLPGLCQYIDQGMSALLIDLEQRGMLKDTLVLW
jgi:hypothetical protein